MPARSSYNAIEHQARQAQAAATARRWRARQRRDAVAARWQLLALVVGALLVLLAFAVLGAGVPRV